MFLNGKGFLTMPILKSLLNNSRLPATTVFIGSFLLFLLQPLTGRTLLPVFGGSASVWMVCLAVYQTLLLVGYGYAHLIARSENGDRPAHFKKLHISLLMSSIVWTLGIVCLRPIIKIYFGGSEDPTLEVLFCGGARSQPLASVGRVFTSTVRRSPTPRE